MKRAEMSEVAAPPVAMRPSENWVLVSLSLCMLLPSLGLSMANIALPTLADALGATFQQVQWVVLAYLLSTTTLIVSVGRLGDLFGRRRLMLAGLALFTVASAAGAAAPGLWTLVAARAAQGVGAALLMALTMAFVADVVPKARTGRAMGLLGTMSAVGTALGPSLGGLLIAGFGWRAFLLVNLPLGLLALALAWRVLPQDRPPRHGAAGFDLPGTLVLGLTLGAYALSMTLGHGRFGGFDLGLFVAALLGIALFAWIESRAPAPLIRIAVWRERGLRAGLATSLLVSTVMMATLVVGPFYLGRGLGLETALAGLAMSAGPIVAAFSGVPAGRLVDRVGARRAVVAGLAGMLAACLALALSPAAAGIAGYVAPLVVLTACYALFQAANNTAVMADVPADRRGVVSGLLNLARNLGFVTGASVMAALFAWGVGTADVNAADAQAVGHAMRTTLAAAAALICAGLVAAWHGSGR